MVAAAWRRLAGAVGGLMLMTGAAAAGPVVTTVDAAEAPALIAQGIPVIDVRRADEWRTTGVVAGSHLITAFDADGRLVPGFVEKVQAEVKPGEPVALICRSGNRSGRVAQLLTEQAGYTHVYNINGGVTRWAQLGQPLQPCGNC